MIRFGLCCIFFKEDIHFRTTTASFLLKKPLLFRKTYLSEIVLQNCENLKKALLYCDTHKIGCFRITSRFFPLYTHPAIAYKIEDLPAAEKILALFEEIKNLAHLKNIRLTMHPDQFVVLNSQSSKVVANSIRELEYHGLLAKLVGADVINIHAGGAYGNKKEALSRLGINLKKISLETREKLSLENDDRSFSPEDLLPFCQKEKIPFVYDVHHHRCLKDSLSIEEATEKALLTWNREPLFHLSSPKNGWKSKNIRSHADYIRIEDFPKHWLQIKKLTVEIEAKKKELAVIDLVNQLGIEIPSMSGDVHIVSLKRHNG